MGRAAERTDSQSQDEASGAVVGAQHRCKSAERANNSSRLVPFSCLSHWLPGDFCTDPEWSYVLQPPGKNQSTFPVPKKNSYGCRDSVLPPVLESPKRRNSEKSFEAF